MSGGRAERILELSEADAVVIMNSREPFLDPSFWYVSQVSGGLFESCAAVLRPGGTELIVSSMEAEEAEGASGTLRIYSNSEELDDLLHDALDGTSVIGVNYSRITLAGAERLRKAAGGAELKDAGKAIDAVRSIKDEDELERIGRACEIASRVAEELPAIIRRGMSEQQAAAEIDSLLRKEGSEGTPFNTIVAFGQNAAKPHHSPGPKILEDGMAVLCDFGASYRRYCSDLTRTMFAGEPREEERRAYEAVAMAQEQGVLAMNPGERASEPDRIARGIIDAAGFAGRFIHSFGHELGLSVHEGGVMSARSQHLLQEGMVSSAEPGIYIPGSFGVRIEDTVHIGPEGPRRLTSFDRSLTIL